LFASLPKFVRGCEHVLNFFHNNEKSRNRDKKSKSAKKEEKAKAKQDSLKNNTKQNETNSKENQKNASLVSLQEEKGNSDSSIKHSGENTEQINDKEKQKENDNNKDKLTLDRLVKPIDGNGTTDHNANQITSSMNGELFNHYNAGDHCWQSSRTLPHGKVGLGFLSAHKYLN
jgi:hypothetical protein